MFFSTKFSDRKSVKTSLRSLTLPKLSGGRSFYVYNGQKHIQVIYKKEMAGFKLGSFAPTKILGYKPKNLKKKNRKKK